MKPSTLLLAFSIAIAFGSCTTAYKTGQTPDDVYFSPAQPKDEYVRMEKRDNRQYSGNDDYYDERYLRMKVLNRSQWSELDDWYYYGNRYNYSYYNYNYWNNPWTPYTYWNCVYNPYYQGSVIIVNPKSTAYSSGPRTFNLNSYTNSNAITNSNYSNPKTAGGSGLGVSNNSGPRRTYTNSYNNNNTRTENTGSFLRNIVTGNSNSTRTTSSTPTNNNSTNSSSNSSSSSSSSSSGSGSSAPVRRF